MKKFNVTVNGKSYLVEVEEVGGAQSFTYAPVQQVHPQAPQFAPVQQAAPQAPQAPQVAKAERALEPVSGETITSPMPGTILDIKVSEGQKVKSGDVLMILEAMKMENEIVSPKDGTVARVHATKGSAVNTGEELITIG